MGIVKASKLATLPCASELCRCTGASCRRTRGNHPLCLVAISSTQAVLVPDLGAFGSFSAHGNDKLPKRSSHRSPSQSQATVDGVLLFDPCSHLCFLLQVGEVQSSSHRLQQQLIFQREPLPIQVHDDCKRLPLDLF